MTSVPTATEHAAPTLIANEKPMISQDLGMRLTNDQAATSESTSSADNPDNIHNSRVIMAWCVSGDGGLQIDAW